MAVNLQAILEAPIIELDTIDSTNNYAMGLVDADTAQPGLTVVARQQTLGKGQRGRQWLDSVGDSLLMSVITTPTQGLDQQFSFNAGVAVGIANVLQNLNEGWDVRIKWPNDIIVNDKKAGGVLIENVIRGSKWMSAIVGFGLNVNQEFMPDELPYATSLRVQSGRSYELESLMLSLRKGILKNVYSGISAQDILEQYNSYLFRKGETQMFCTAEEEWTARVEKVVSTGQLEVETANGVIYYTHGMVNWKWS